MRHFIMLFLLCFEISMVPMQVMSMEEQETVCSICCDQLYGTNRDVVTLRCHRSHSFHHDCLTDYFRRHGVSTTCPLCRSPICSEPGKHTGRLYDTIKDEAEFDCTALTAWLKRMMSCRRCPETYSSDMMRYHDPIVFYP